MLMNSLTDFGQVSVARCRNTSILGCIATTGESEQCFVRAADWAHIDAVLRTNFPFQHPSLPLPITDRPCPRRVSGMQHRRKARSPSCSRSGETCPVDVVEHRRMAAMPKMHTTKLKKQMVTNVLPVGVLWTLTRGTCVQALNYAKRYRIV